MKDKEKIQPVTKQVNVTPYPTSKHRHTSTSSCDSDSSSGSRKRSSKKKDYFTTKRDDSEEDDTESEEEIENEDEDSSDDDILSYTSSEVLKRDVLHFVLSKLFVSKSGKNIADLLEEISGKLTQLSR